MKIKKIVLEIKGKEISLTPEQAQALYFELNKLFNTPTTPWIWSTSGTSITLSDGDMSFYGDSHVAAS